MKILKYLIPAFIVGLFIAGPIYAQVASPNYWKQTGTNLVPINSSNKIGSSTTNGAFNNVTIAGTCTGCGAGGGGASTSTSNTWSGTQSFATATAQSFNNILYVPSNFATAGCAGSSTATTFQGCVTALYQSQSALASTTNPGGVTIIANFSVTSTWTGSINFNINGLIPSFDCGPGVNLQYNGTGTAMTFNAGNPAGHVVSQDFGCTYMGSSTLLNAGKTFTATTTGIFFGGTQGAVGIDFHDNNINGFATCAATGANTYMFTFRNNAVSGCGTTATSTKPYAGSLLYVSPASNSGERFIITENSFTDPNNSTSANAIYIDNNAVASMFFTQNSADDASIFIGISNGIEDFEQNHFENAAYSTYLMQYFILASSSGATSLNVNDNVFALDNTNGTGKLSELIEHAVNLVFNSNIVENYGGASAITNCIDHTINPGQAIETANWDWSQNTACSNWMQLTGTPYPAMISEYANGYPAEQYTTGGSVGTFINGQQTVGTDDNSGQWTFLTSTQVGCTAGQVATGTAQVCGSFGITNTAAAGSTVLSNIYGNKSNSVQVFTGGSIATDTLPRINQSQGIMYFFKNRGTAVLSISASSTAGDGIYGTGAVTTSSAVALNPGSSTVMYNDGSFWDELWKQ